ncbi:MAG TPA: 30S ribosomal protein S17 [Gammaproteobacteria bacterium]|nr:30S ribosomal protein S17 [Gammaproteobacteria bacterium]
MSDSSSTDQADKAEHEAASKKAARVMVGHVVSDKMQKSITVLVERRVKHPLYKKYVKRSSKIHAHDEKDECRVGDKVSIEPCRPLSKTKAWRLHEILDRAE